MERRRSPLRVLAYGVVGFLLAGCLISGAVEIAADGRRSEFTPGVIGFGGTLFFVIVAGQAVMAARLFWREGQLQLFGEETSALLIDKKSWYDSDNTAFWTAHVEGPGFRQVVDTGMYDPGPVGEPVRVLWHAGSGQVSVIARRPGPAVVLLRQLWQLVAVLVLSAFATLIGGLLIWWATGRL